MLFKSMLKWWSLFNYYIYKAADYDTETNLK